MSSTLRCLKVLDLLASSSAELSRLEVAQALSIPMPTAHRLLATLCQSGLVEQDPSTRRYRLTAKALWVGAAFLLHSPVYRASFVFMQDLARKINGMVHLGILEGDAILFLHSAGLPDTVYLFADIGERHPAHATAMGKAILAYRPKEEAAAIFSRVPAACTGRTITAVEAFLKELRRTRETGYAVNDEELMEGVRAVAAPIFNKKGEVVASISISGSSVNLSRERLAQHGVALTEVARKISMQLGYRPINGGRPG